MRRARCRGVGPGRSGSRRVGRRAVSDVVATILLLALTVVLFSSIFAFVTSFPAPPAQNSNQFQAQLITGANGTGTMVVAVSILHLAGPGVPSTALIYLKSAIYPLGPEFINPYTVAAGGIAGSIWNLGQTWYLTNFTASCGAGHTSICNPILPDNITVYIVSGSTLLFSAVIPGTVINTPPTFISTFTTPANPAVGEYFQVFAAIQGVVASNTVKLNVSGVPGSWSTTTVAMSYWPQKALWVYNVSAGITNKSGGWYGFLSAITSAGKTGTTAVPISIATLTTQLSTALTLGAVTTPTKCTGSQNPYAACYLKAGTSYYFTVTITSSYVTFGSVLFSVVTTTTPRGAYSATYDAVFALSLESSVKTPVANWTESGASTTTWAMTMPSTGWSYYATGYTANSWMIATASTGGYIISVDMGTATPPTTLMFVATGTGPYSGSVSVAIP